MGHNLVQRKTYGAVPCQVLCAGVTGQCLSQVTQCIQEACGQGSQSRQAQRLPGEHLDGAVGVLCPGHSGHSCVGHLERPSFQSGLV